jgi:hypothetical protein
MPNYSNFLSSYGQQANPLIPSLGGGNILDMGQTLNGVGDLSQMGGGGSLADALSAYTANAGKFSTKDMINTGLTGVQTIGGLIGAFGSLGLAKKQYGLSKRMAETNLSNSVGAYNNALDDKARSRAVVEGQSDTERDAYIAANRAHA